MNAFIHNNEGCGLHNYGGEYQLKGMKTKISYCKVDWHLTLYNKKSKSESIGS